MGHGEREITECRELRQAAPPIVAVVPDVCDFLNCWASKLAHTSVTHMQLWVGLVNV